MTNNDHKQPKARPQGLTDDAWLEHLCAWADEFEIPKEALPRDKANLRAITELKLMGKGLTTLV